MKAGTIRGINEPEVGLYPFWFWNGDQQKCEIHRQMELIHKSGCRGIAIHSRVGNRTPYLSERWMELVRFTCSEAQKMNLKIWLYDEDGFPSGNAGGEVQKMNPDLMQKSLRFAYEKSSSDKPAFAAFEPVNFRRVDESLLPEGTELLRFHVELIPEHVDTFHPEAVKKFITLTHEKYAKHLFDFFGNVIQAIYTDDESLLICCRDVLPWSNVLEVEWRKRYHGESLREQLPLLVEDLPGFRDVRVRFYALAQELFLTRFIAPQKDWAERHGLIYTGHLSCDEGPLNISIRSYHSSMPYYKLQTIPSIDDFLCDMLDQRYLCRTHTGGNNQTLHARSRAPLTLYKNASSVAHQFANDLLSCEILTLLTWDCTPAFLDRQMLFETAMGVNLMTPHAFFYTIGRHTRDDCPPSYFFQQPFHPMLRHIFRVWTKIAALLRTGTFYAPLLLLRNARTAALQNGAMATDKAFVPRLSVVSEDMRSLDEREADTVLRLHRAHVGFDFGDETFLESEASVTEDGNLLLGNMTYSIVMMPPLDDILDSTKRLLAEFVARGGILLPFGQLQMLSADLEMSCDGAEEILIHTRLLDNGRKLYFLVNLADHPLCPKISLNTEFAVYDPRSDRVVHTGKELPDNFVFPPGTSFFLTEPDFQAEPIPFEASVFAPFSAERATAVVLTEIRLLNENILAFHKTMNCEFNVLAGAKVTRLYAEDIADNIPNADGMKADWIPVAPHEADPCYQGMDVSSLFPAGQHSVTFAATMDGSVYLGGIFRVSGTTLGPETPLTLGNLAEQGCPDYWGRIEYNAEFTGKHNRLQLDLIAGAAEVSINGIYAGVIAGAPYQLHIGTLCGEGNNSLKITYANTARNFITGEKAPFGIFAIRLLHV